METSVPASGMKIIPISISLDEALIQESLDTFRRMKQSRGSFDDNDDSQLDSLQKQKKKKSKSI